MKAWWQPEDSDPEPTISVDIAYEPCEIYTARSVWRDVGLDYAKGILSKPVGYVIEARIRNGEWISVLDKSDNRTDMLIDSPQKQQRCACESLKSRKP